MARQKAFQISFNPIPYNHWIAECSVQWWKEVQFRWPRWLGILLVWYFQKTLIFFSRQQGGGSLIVWGAFSYNGTTDIVLLKGYQCSEDYQKMLES